MTALLQLLQTEKISLNRVVRMLLRQVPVTVRFDHGTPEEDLAEAINLVYNSQPRVICYIGWHRG